MEDYPLLHMLWTMLLIFGFVIWFWLLIMVFGDIFSRKDCSGGKKAIWIIFLIIIPLAGVLIYMIVNSHHMAERRMAAVQAAQKDFDDHVKEVAGGSAAQIDKAKQLLDSGAITQEEFEALKKKALS